MFVGCIIKNTLFFVTWAISETQVKWREENGKLYLTFHVNHGQDTWERSVLASTFWWDIPIAFISVS
jgi:hypothetical protein